MENGLSGMNGALFVSVVAFCVVMVVLGAMALFMRALGWTVTKANGISRNRQKTAPTPDSAAAGPADGIDDETVAAVTAAVTTMMGTNRFQVTGIRPVGDHKPGWVVSGPGNVPDSSDRWRRR